MKSTCWLLAGVLAVVVLVGPALAASIPSERNVALGKLTWGTEGAGPSYPTSGANDGDKTTFSHGDGSTDSWWRVDLQEAFDLGSIRVTSRQWAPERTNGATMRVYDAANTQIGSNVVLEPYVGNEAAQTISFNNGGAGWSGARYILVGGVGLSPQYLHLAELAAMADVSDMSLYPGFITGISALASSNGYGDVTRTSDELVNNSGMDDADGPVLGRPDALHSQTNNNFWDDETVPTVTFDLGGTYSLDRMLIWNDNQIYNSNRGLKEVNILTSTDGENFTLLEDDLNGGDPGMATIPRAPGGDSGYQSDVDLTGITASHVRIEGLSNYGGDHWGLAEVRFYRAFLPGDANGDRVVDDKDASILGAHWMQSGDWGDGDFNRDGLVNDKDAAILAAHWSQGGGEESVPEPGVCVLLAAGLVALGLRRRAG